MQGTGPWILGIQDNRYEEDHSLRGGLHRDLSVIHASSLIHRFVTRPAQPIADQVPAEHCLRLSIVRTLLLSCSLRATRSRFRLRRLALCRERHTCPGIEACQTNTRTKLTPILMNDAELQSAPMTKLTRADLCRRDHTASIPTVHPLPPCWA